MSYRQTLEFLYSQYPVFQRIGASAYKPDLNNTIALLEVVNEPQKAFKSIHVAGTNGKGSTSHMLASILQEAGYKTGLYTSPHLKDFRERIRVNGKMISKQEVIRFTQKHKYQFKKIQPSFFEVTVAMAFDYFRKKKVDIAIIETGLGGRLDSTNVIVPELSIITNIGFDHMQFLGNTLPKIASEKAGIIKKNIPVIIGEWQRETHNVFKAKAGKETAPLVFASKQFGKKNYDCALKGSFQKKNIQTVLVATEQLRNSGWVISEKHIRAGLKNVIENTGLQGRWQTLQKNPKVICDIGHNTDGIREIMQQLKQEKFGQLHVVIGTVNDKDVDAMLQQFPKNALYYFTQAKIPRALAAEELMRKAKVFHLNGIHYNSVKKALNAALRSAEKKDLILVCGSAFVVAEAI
ncbi:MAG: bifunctional folylpolyglutamate synthase/dihydrofolate synthase [Flavobacteriales bacterium]